MAGIKMYQGETAWSTWTSAIWTSAGVKRFRCLGRFAVNLEDSR